MGIDIETARFLCSSKQTGASFHRCLTLGRQNYFLGNTETRMLLREFGWNPQEHPDLFAEPYSRFKFSDAFWKFLGAEELVTLDASEYEGANRIHDLNQPAPEDLKRRFDAVCDFGTLEHVFHFPVALQNCLEMVALGGRFYAQTPANNFFGHGFYQFSPELFHRVLSPTNGYTLERLVAVEYGPSRTWYDVPDPAAIRSRVALVNSFPTTLLVQARRTEIVPILQAPPQQSDYAAQWSNGASPAQSGVLDSLASPKLDQVKGWLLERMPRLARVLETCRYFGRTWSLRNRAAFTPVRRSRRP